MSLYRKNKYYYLMFTLLFFIVLSYIQSHPSKKKPTTNTTSTTSQLLSPTPAYAHPNVLGRQTKTSGCVVNNSLPDKDCTPGSAFLNVTKEQVCTFSYSKSVRNVSQKTKNAVYKEYGVISHGPGEYEVDHLIPLELGGSNEIANLWPEAGEPRPGYHEKDRVENYLHDKVCLGKISLLEAQQKIASDWYAVYLQIPQ